MIIRRVPRTPLSGWSSPFEELEAMRQRLGRLTEPFSGDWSREPMAGVFPALNVTEDKDNFYVRAELPGIKAEELDISVTGNDLTISGERKIPSEGENARYHRREREAGRFSRILSLPAQIESSRVEARCADGILTVVLPKSEQARPRQITVKTS